MNSVIEQIRLRRSVRAFTGEPLQARHESALLEYIAGLSHPFGGKARIEYLPLHMGSAPVRLGTYGVISGAPAFLAMIYDNSSALGKTGASYMFEQALLYCTDMGLGSCWLGGAFSRSNFKKLCNLSPTERLPIVSPVGYPVAKAVKPPTPADPALMDRPRKPFGATFFSGSFGNPLTPEAAGSYATPFEMVRLAPSANNMQPWRVVADAAGFHFYKTFSFGFASVDAGIALCHFEQTCRELGLSGSFKALGAYPEGRNAAYVISWVR
ncbi:MAG: nitroreductase family protein [Tannerellaceae bacterium]|jgi:nitroreductase|nr:nitroreductase family protein [Tannerellaceae bacterium]